MDSGMCLFLSWAGAAAVIIIIFCTEIQPCQSKRSCDLCHACVGPLTPAALSPPTYQSYSSQPKGYNPVQCLSPCFLAESFLNETRGSEMVPVLCRSLRLHHKGLVIKYCAALLFSF